jgi:hypothetical protein
MSLEFVPGSTKLWIHQWSQLQQMALSHAHSTTIQLILKQVWIQVSVVRDDSVINVVSYLSQGTIIAVSENQSSIFVDDSTGIIEIEVSMINSYDRSQDLLKPGKARALSLSSYMI